MVTSAYCPHHPAGAPTYIDVLEGITEDYETEDEGKHGGDDKLPAVCW
jgi:hypothetical protein